MADPQDDLMKNRAEGTSRTFPEERRAQGRSNTVLFRIEDMTSNSAEARKTIGLIPTPGV